MSANPIPESAVPPQDERPAAGDQTLDAQVRLALSSPEAARGAELLLAAAPMSVLVRAARAACETGEIWKPFEAIRSLPDASRGRRRMSYAANKAVGGFAPVAELYAKGVRTPRRLALLIDHISRRFPAEPEVAAALVERLPPAFEPSAFFTDLHARMSALGSERLLSGWGAIHLAARLAEVGEPGAAIAMAHRASQPPNDAFMRFNAMRALSKAHEAAGDWRPAIEAMVTSLLLIPEHVSMVTALRHLLELLRLWRPQARVSYDTASLADEAVDYVNVNGFAFLPLRLIRELWRREFLTPEEIADLELAFQQTVPLLHQEIAAETFSQPPPKAVVDPPPNNAQRVFGLDGRRQPVWSGALTGVDYIYNDGFQTYLTPAGGLVQVLSTGAACYASRLQSRGKPVVQIEQPVVNITLPWGRFNYSHFLLDRIPRLFLLAKTDKRAVLIEPESVEPLKDFLGLAGLDREVIPVEPGFVYRLADVKCFNEAQHPAQGGARPYLDVFRSTVASQAWEPDFKIFIHRDRGRRGIENQEAVYDLVRSLGFEIVALETLSIAEQARTFARAGMIAGLHGAGLSNIVFCDPRAQVVEIIPHHYWTPAYRILAGQIPCAYSVMYAPARSTADRQFSDIEVNLDSLRGLLS